MNNPLAQLGQLKKMRDEAMKLKKELEAEQVTVEKNGVEILISGDQHIKELKTNGRSDNDIKDAVNEAIKKSQEVGARKFSQMSGGIQGLLGR
jgi:DNA-binding protein YbaB